jgi:hypothetical protein
MKFVPKAVRYSYPRGRPRRGRIPMALRGRPTPFTRSAADLFYKVGELATAVGY